MESIQRRATKLVKNIRQTPYELRKKELEIQALVECKKRDDLIQMLKIAKGIDSMLNTVDMLSAFEPMFIVYSAVVTAIMGTMVRVFSLVTVLAIMGGFVLVLVGITMVA
ncbi:unnamed protein product [Brachionus calyciflorus]|uniref:Uncharacterized protein n=1 Tax=Brachionus calyciflorus TaxID=104777 RepID=A0A814IKW4_9BILA|nr:unnamed protein product [Brachionus calyciflorus]